MERRTEVYRGEYVANGKVWSIFHWRVWVPFAIAYPVFWFGVIFVTSLFIPEYLSEPYSMLFVGWAGFFSDTVGIWVPVSLFFNLALVWKAWKWYIPIWRRMMNVLERDVLPE